MALKMGKNRLVLAQKAPLFSLDLPTSEKLLKLRTDQHL